MARNWRLLRSETDASNKNANVGRVFAFYDTFTLYGSWAVPGAQMVLIINYCTPIIAVICTTLQYLHSSVFLGILFLPLSTEVCKKGQCSATTVVLNFACMWEILPQSLDTQGGPCMPLEWQLEAGTQNPSHWLSFWE